MTKGIYLMGAILAPVSLVLVFTGPMILEFLALGGATACLSFALFMNPAIIAKNIRFKNPAAKQAPAYFIAGLMGLIALTLAMVPFILPGSPQ